MKLVYMCGIDRECRIEPLSLSIYLITRQFCKDTLLALRQYFTVENPCSLYHRRQWCMED